MVRVVAVAGIHGDLGGRVPQVSAPTTCARLGEHDAVHLGGDVVDLALLRGRLADRDRPVGVRVVALEAGGQVEPEHLAHLEPPPGVEVRAHVRDHVAERARVHVGRHPASVQELGAGRGHALERVEAELVLVDALACRLDRPREAGVGDRSGLPDALGVVGRRAGDDVLPHRHGVAEGRVGEAPGQDLGVDGGHLAGEDADAPCRQAGGTDCVPDGLLQLVGEPPARRVRVRPHVLDPGHPPRLVEVPRLVDEKHGVAVARDEQERAGAGKDVDVAGEEPDRVAVRGGRAPDEEPVELARVQGGARSLEASRPLLGRRLGRPAPRLLEVDDVVENAAHSRLPPSPVAISRGRSWPGASARSSPRSRSGRPRGRDRTA